MNNDKLLYSKCLEIYDIEASFLDSLADSGLIQIVLSDDEKFIESDCLSDFEKFVRWYYDLNINIEGIEALSHMLIKVESLQKEVNRLQEELHFYKHEDIHEIF
ncbi:MAG: chaperone modulator CbpM [Paludibacter sp.]|nr:chaperone modulator CbpM [Paludibacter sp.]